MHRPACCECGKENSAYRCPTCCEYYCSVTCCREHKTKNCSPPPPKEDKKEVEYEHPTEDTVPLEKLKLLEQNSELMEIIKDPLLRNIIQDINSHRDPNKAIEFYMEQPEFSKFVNVILNTVDHQENEDAGNE